MAYFIHDTAIIGAEFRYLQGGIKSIDPKKYGPPILPKDLYIGPYAIIGLNCVLGEGVVIDAYCKIDPGARIDTNTLITYRATVAAGVSIGRDCIIGGNVSEQSVVGNNCRVFGKLVHKHLDSTISWDFHNLPEPGVTIHDNSLVGHDSTLIGGIEVGPNSYVCSGAIVTKNVPPLNNIVHFSQWKGELANNPIFQNR